MKDLTLKLGQALSDLEGIARGRSKAGEEFERRADDIFDDLASMSDYSGKLFMRVDCDDGLVRSAVSLHNKTRSLTDVITVRTSYILKSIAALMMATFGEGKSKDTLMATRLLLKNGIYLLSMSEHMKALKCIRVGLNGWKKLNKQVLQRLYSEIEREELYHTIFCGQMALVEILCRVDPKQYDDQIGGPIEDVLGHAATQTIRARIALIETLTTVAYELGTHENIIGAGKVFAKILSFLKDHDKDSTIDIEQIRSQYNLLKKKTMLSLAFCYASADATATLALDTLQQLEDDGDIPAGTGSVMLNSKLMVLCRLGNFRGAVDALSQLINESATIDEALGAVSSYETATGYRNAAVLHYQIIEQRFSGGGARKKSKLAHLTAIACGLDREASSNCPDTTNVRHSLELAAQELIEAILVDQTVADVESTDLENIRGQFIPLVQGLRVNEDWRRVVEWCRLLERIEFLLVERLSGDILPHHVMCMCWRADASLHLDFATDALAVSREAMNKVVAPQTISVFFRAALIVTSPLAAVEELVQVLNINLNRDGKPEEQMAENEKKRTFCLTAEDSLDVLLHCVSITKKASIAPTARMATVSKLLDYWIESYIRLNPWKSKLNFIAEQMALNTSPSRAADISALVSTYHTEAGHSSFFHVITERLSILAWQQVPEILTGNQDKDGWKGPASPRVKADIIKNTFYPFFKAVCSILRKAQHMEEQVDLPLYRAPARCHVEVLGGAKNLEWIANLSWNIGLSFAGGFVGAYEGQCETSDIHIQESAKEPCANNLSMDIYEESSVKGKIAEITEESIDVTKGAQVIDLDSFDQNAPDSVIGEADDGRKREREEDSTTPGCLGSAPTNLQNDEPSEGKQSVKREASPNDYTAERMEASASDSESTSQVSQGTSTRVLTPRKRVRYQLDHSPACKNEKSGAPKLKPHPSDSVSVCLGSGALFLDEAATLYSFLSDEPSRYNRILGMLLTVALKLDKVRIDSEQGIREDALLSTDETKALAKKLDSSEIEIKSLQGTAGNKTNSSCLPLTDLQRFAIMLRISLLCRCAWTNDDALEAPLETFLSKEKQTLFKLSATELLECASLARQEGLGAGWDGSHAGARAASCLLSVGIQQVTRKASFTQGDLNLLGDLYLRAMDCADSREAGLALIEEFNQIVQGRARTGSTIDTVGGVQRSSIFEREQVNQVCAKAYNWAQTLVQLQSFGLAVRFLDAAAKLLDFTTETFNRNHGNCIQSSRRRALEAR
jgi:hypothetical protein